MDSDESMLLKEFLELNHILVRDIFPILENQGINLLFSHSFQALALLLLSAAGYEPVEAYFNLRIEKEKTHLLMEQLKDPHLKIACKVFKTPDCNIECSFESLMMEYFNCSFETVDFNQSAAATEKINSWISENTENIIPPMAQQVSMDERCGFLFVNTLHFKDQWKYKFSKDQTYNEPFYSTKDDFKYLPMMHIESSFKYLEEEFYKVVEIPYRDENFRLLILLPKDIDGLRELEEKLVQIEFRDMFSKLYDQKVCLTLPKFKHFKLNDELKNVLQIQDMKTAFDKYAKKFSGKSYSEEESAREIGQERIVKTIRHKSVLEMDEEGSEIAEVVVPNGLRLKTVQETKSISSCHEEQPVRFEADHPFIFLILHQDTILFMGNYK